MLKKISLVLIVMFAQLSFARDEILLINDTDYPSDWYVKTSQAWCCGIDQDKNGNVGCMVHIAPHQRYTFNFHDEQKKRGTNPLCFAPCTNTINVVIHERKPFELIVDQQGQALKIAQQMAWIGGTTLLLGGPVLPAAIAAAAAIGIQCFDSEYRVKKVLLSSDDYDYQTGEVQKNAPKSPSNIPYTYIMEMN